MARTQSLAISQAILCLLPYFFFSGLSQLTQAPCQPGTYYDSIFESTGTPCVLCPRGYFSDKFEATMCEKCPPGTTTLAVGSRECVSEVRLCTRPLRRGGKCAKRGWYLATSGECEQCPQGTFQYFPGFACCFSCRPGTSTQYVGMQSLFHCKPLHCPNLSIESGFTSLKVSWDAVRFRNVHYTLRVVPQGGKGVPLTIPVSAGSHIARLSVNVPGLKANTQYKVQLEVHVGIVTISCPPELMQTASLSLNVKEKSGLDCIWLTWDWDYEAYPNVVFSISVKNMDIDDAESEDLITSKNFILIDNLTPGTKYWIHIRVKIFDVTVLCVNLTICTLKVKMQATKMEGIVDGIVPRRHGHIDFNFPNCVNGTLLVIQKMDADRYVVNGTTYHTVAGDAPRMLYSSHNSGGLRILGKDGHEVSDFSLHYTCTDLLRMDDLLEMMDDCTVRHCMKNDSFVHDLIALTNGDLTEALWTRLCPFTSLWAVRVPMKCHECPYDEPPSCPYPYGKLPAYCPCQFGGPCPLRVRPKHWNCTRRSLYHK